MDPKPPVNSSPHSSSDAAGPNVIPEHYTEIAPAERTRAEQSGLLYYWRLMRRRRGNLLVSAFLGAMAGLVFTLPQTRMYRAHGSIEIRDPTGIAPDYAASDAYLQTQMRILQSKTLTDRVLKKMKGAGQLDTSGSASRWSAWIKVLGVKKQNQAEASEVAGRELTGSLVIRSVGQTRILEIYADSPSPQSAANFVNTLSNEFIQQFAEGLAQRSGTSPVKELDEMRARMQASEQRLRAYEQQSASAKDNGRNESLQQIERELEAVRSDRANKLALYELLMNTPADSRPDVWADAAMQQGIANLAVLRRQLSELNEKYTSRHPRIVAAQEQVTATVALLENQKKVYITRVYNEYQDAISREKQLSGSYKGQARMAVDEVNQRAHTELLREIETNRQLYEQMVQRAQHPAVPSLPSAALSRIVDPAEVPDRPYKPNVAQIAAFGLLGGLLLGIAFVVTREQADNTIQQPGDASALLGARELGAIPPAGRGHKRSPKTAGGELSASAVPAMTQPEFISSNEGAFGFAESIRSVLLSIVYTGNDGDFSRVLAVTSPSAGEGKTTIAANLAMAFSGLNRKVLLIDGDLRKPRIHEIFGLPKDAGLGDLLEGTDSFTDVDDTLIRQTNIKNLYVLSSGVSSDDSALLVHDKRLQKFLRHFREHFDVVIIDSPPAMAIPDARVIGRMADEVVVVVRAGRTVRDAAAAMYQRLQEDGISVLGIVLNDWDPRKAVRAYDTSYDTAYKYKQKDTTLEEVKR